MVCENILEMTVVVFWLYLDCVRVLVPLARAQRSGAWSYRLGGGWRACMKLRSIPG